MPNDPIGFEDQEGRIPGSGGGSGVDELVKVSDNDTTAGTLEDKVVAGTGITLSTLNDGANEQLRISAQAGAGSDDEEIIFDFDYTTSSPALVATMSPAGTVSGVRMHITTAFDGTADLTVGVIGNTDLLMQTDEIDETLVAAYEVNPAIDLADTDDVNLYLNLSGVTQGSGRIILNITR